MRKTTVSSSRFDEQENNAIAAALKNESRTRAGLIHFAVREYLIKQGYLEMKEAEVAR